MVGRRSSTRQRRVPAIWSRPTVQCRKEAAFQNAGGGRCPPFCRPFRPGLLPLGLLPGSPCALAGAEKPPGGVKPFDCEPPVCKGTEGSLLLPTGCIGDDGAVLYRSSCGCA